MNSYATRHARLPGKWFYERAVCDCGCVIITAGRQQLQRGEELFCEKHDRVAKVVRVESATLEQQERLTRIDDISEPPASAVANGATMKANA